MAEETKFVIVLINSMLMNKVLLHACCAPCSSAILEWLLNNGYTPILYFCNPNIYPLEEYESYGVRYK